MTRDAAQQGVELCAARLTQSIALRHRARRLGESPGSVERALKPRDVDQRRGAKAGRFVSRAIPKRLERSLRHCLHVPLRASHLFTEDGFAAASLESVEHYV
jgi:hypothetical protein